MLLHFIQYLSVQAELALVEIRDDGAIAPLACEPLGLLFDLLGDSPPLLKHNDSCAQYRERGTMSAPVLRLTHFPQLSFSRSSSPGRKKLTVGTGRAPRD